MRTREEIEKEPVIYNPETGSIFAVMAIIIELLLDIRELILDQRDL